MSLRRPAFLFDEGNLKHNGDLGQSTEEDDSTVSREMLAVMVLALLLSLGLIYFGLYGISRPSYPTLQTAADLCNGCSTTEVNGFQAVLVYEYDQATIVPRTLAQVGIGLAAGLSIALLLSTRLREALVRGKGERSPNVALTQSRKEWLRFLGLSAFLVGIAGFTFLGTSGIYYDNTGDKQSIAAQTIHFADSIFGAHVGFSIMATLFLAVASVGGATFWSENWVNGLKGGFMVIAAPSAILFTTGIRLYDDKEMAIHATNLLIGISVNYTDLISNWTILVAAFVILSAGIYEFVSPRLHLKERESRSLMAGIMLIGAFLITLAIATE